MDRGAWQATIRGVARAGHLASKPPASLICSRETGKFLLRLVRSSSWETSWFQINICQCRDIRDADLIPESGRSPGEGNGNTHQYSCLGNPTDRGARQARVHGLTKIRIWLVTKQHLPTSLRNYRGWTPGSGTPLSLPSLPTLTWLLLPWAMAKNCPLKISWKERSDPGWL